MQQIPLPGPKFTRLYLENQIGLSKDQYERLWHVMTTLGYSDFLSEDQGKITLKFLNDENVFGVMPTSGGKSFTFQTVARMSDGLTIIITPLIALARDQVKHSSDGMAHSWTA